MNKNSPLKEIWDKLMKCKRVAMSLHYGPDGDSLGSCTAMKYVLEKKGVKVTLVSSDKLSENLQNLSFVNEVDFTTDVSDLNEKNYDAFIFLDCGTLTKVSGKLLADYKLPKSLIINIDHHDGNRYYGDLNYVDATKSSVCSLLVDFFRENKVTFDKELAKRLLIGMCTDNGFFIYPKDAEDDFEKTLFLIKTGVDYIKDVSMPIMSNTSLKLKKLHGRILENLKIDEKRKIAWSLISEEEIKNLKLNRAELRLGIIAIQDLANVDIVFTLTQFENHVKGSFRSKEKDISIVARELGGGGHKKASAFFMENTTLKKAEKKVLETIDKFYPIN